MIGVGRLRNTLHGPNYAVVPVSRGLLRMEEMIIHTLKKILLVAAAVQNVLVAVAVTAILSLLTPHPT